MTERLDSMPNGCDFLVYTQYDLEPFTARQRPLRRTCRSPGGPVVRVSDPESLAHAA